jgi:hypothetical protein
VGEFNGIMNEYDALAGGASVPTALTRRCERAVAALHATGRKAKKEGGTAPPKNTRDAVMVLVAETRKQNDLLAVFVDSYRSVVSSSLAAP